MGNPKTDKKFKYILCDYKEADRYDDSTYSEVNWEFTDEYSEFIEKLAEHLGHSEYIQFVILDGVFIWENNPIWDTWKNDVTDLRAEQERKRREMFAKLEAESRRKARKQAEERDRAEYLRLKEKFEGK